MWIQRYFGPVLLILYVVALAACGGGDSGGTNGGNPVAGISVTPGPSLLTNESGTTATFSIVLDTAPSADVVLSISSADIAEGLLSAGAGQAGTVELTFTNANWDTAQTVTVHGQDDAVADGNKTYQVRIAPATSADAAYDGLDPADLTVTNVDNENAGVTVDTSGLVNISEAGGITGLQVVLNAAPEADVTVPVTSLDVSELAVGPASLVFTPANWDQPQSVTLTGVDDAIADGDQIVTVRVGPSSSSSTVYDGLSTSGVRVTVTDNETGGLVFNRHPTLQTTESGGSDSFTVALKTEPLADVVVTFTSSDTTEVLVSLDAGVSTAVSQSITFTPADWNTPRTVTVVGQPDTLFDGAVSLYLKVDTASSVSAYQGLTGYNFLMSNADTNPGINMLESGGSHARATSVTIPEVNSGGGRGLFGFTLALNTAPTADVTINLSVVDTTEACVSVGGIEYSSVDVTFTPADWSTQRYFSVIAYDDGLLDGDQTTTLVVGAAVSADPAYNGWDATDIPVTVVDTNKYDLRSIVIPSPVVLGETGSPRLIQTLGFELWSIPTADVTVTLTASDSSEIEISSPTGYGKTATMVFTPTNWTSEQSVNIRAVDDTVVDGDQTVFVVTSITSSDPNYAGVNPADIPITVVDDEVAGISFATTSLALTESVGSRSGSSSVVLSTQPAADVIVNLTSSDAAQATVSPASLTFTSADWSTPQTVTVTAVDDALVDGTQNVNILASTSSPGTPYDGLSSTAIAVTVSDDDSVGVTVLPAALTVTEDVAVTPIKTISLVLDSMPYADVTIPVASADSSQVQVAPASVTFTQADWATPKLVAVQAVDDIYDDGDQTVSILVGPATSGDGAYNGFDPADVTATVVDNDAAGVTITPASVNIIEGGSAATFGVSLATPPVADVTLSLSSSNTAKADITAPGFSASPVTLTFTPLDWSTAQTVSVTAPVNGLVDPGAIISIVTDPTSSSDVAYSGIDPIDVSVAIENVDDHEGTRTNPVLIGDMTGGGPVTHMTAYPYVGVESFMMVNVNPSTSYTISVPEQLRGAVLIYLDAAGLLAANAAVYDCRLFLDAGPFTCTLTTGPTTTALYFWTIKASSSWITLPPPPPGINYFTLNIATP